MSHRGMIWLLGVLAGGLALLARFGGLFRGWEAGLPVGQGRLPLWVEVVCTLLFAFGTAFVGMQVTSSKFRTGLLLASLLQPVSAWAVGALAGCWISPFPWLLAIVVAWLGVTAYQFSNAGKKERLIRGIFGKNVSETALSKLLELPDATLPQTSPATILSARYLGVDWHQIEELADHLRQQSAWVELQTGNRLLAVWNMPLSNAAFAENAVEATLAMTPHWQVGVATGEVSGEFLPTTEHWQMRGTVFEKADALCQANTTFGSHVLIDLATTDRVREAIVLRPVDFLLLPATDTGVEVFEPLALSKLATREAVAQRDSFWQGVIFFRQKRFPESLAAFRKSGDDAVVRYYLNRLEKLTSSY